MASTAAGDYVEGLAAHFKALELDPSFREGWIHLAQVTLLLFPELSLPDIELGIPCCSVQFRLLFLIYSTSETSITRIQLTGYKRTVTFYSVIKIPGRLRRSHRVALLISRSEFSRFDMSCILRHHQFSPYRRKETCFSILINSLYSIQLVSKYLQILSITWRSSIQRQYRSMRSAQDITADFSPPIISTVLVGVR